MTLKITADDTRTDSETEEICVGVASPLRETGGPDEGSLEGLSLSFAEIKIASADSDSSQQEDLILETGTGGICFGDKCENYEAPTGTEYDSDNFVNQSGDGIKGSFHVGDLQLPEDGTACIGTGCANGPLNDAIDPSGPALGASNKQTDPGFILDVRIIKPFDGETNIGDKD